MITWALVAFPQAEELLLTFHECEAETTDLMLQDISRISARLNLEGGA